MARETLRAGLSRAIQEVGLGSYMVRAVEVAKSLLVRNHPRADAFGVPFPPPLLMIQVVGSADPQGFLENGKLCCDLIFDAVRRQGQIASTMRILDFGGGCGRVARHWSAKGVRDVFLSDYNRRAVKWVQKALPNVVAEVNGLSPPLKFSDGFFDLAYALSVFTHLPEDLQRSWMSELRRVVKPGGLIYFTTKGDAHAMDLPEGSAERAAYSAGKIAVINRRVAGSNLCAAYAPRSWIESNLLDGFEMLEFSPGVPEMMGSQEIFLVRRVD